MEVGGEVLPGIPFPIPQRSKVRGRVRCVTPLVTSFRVEQVCDGNFSTRF